MLHFLLDIGLLDQVPAGNPGPGKVLARSVCFLHDRADNPNALLRFADGYACTTNECHKDRKFGCNLPGLVRHMVYRGSGEVMDGRRAWGYAQANVPRLKGLVGDLADGFHRAAAAKQAGRDTLEAKVIEGGRRDALLFAAGANAGHGLRRTNADKHRAVRLLLADAEWGSWSDAEIARRCAVSDRFVSGLRRELSPNGLELPSPRKATRNGRTYAIDTTRIGKAGRLAPDVRDALRDTPFAEDKKELRRLSRLDEDQQRAVAGKLVAGEAKGVRPALKLLQAEDIAQEPPPLPTGPFRVVVADPPWTYAKRSGDPTQRGACPYPCLSVDEMKALPVADLAERDAVLWLWTTNAHLEEAFGVARAWGFEPRTVLTWVKNRMGTGDWLRGRTEHCLLAVRGQPMVSLTNQTTVLEGPVREHSRKPEEFFRLVASLCPGSKVELLARTARTGWAAHGDQVGLFAAA